MLQHPELSQGGLQLLPAALQLLLQLRVDDAQLLVLQPDVGLLAAHLLDPGVQLSDQTASTQGFLLLFFPGRGVPHGSVLGLLDNLMFV